MYTALTIFLQEGDFGTLSVLHREDLSTPIVMHFPMMECIVYTLYLLHTLSKYIELDVSTARL